MTEFSVTLFSNSNQHLFANTLSSFRTLLAYPLVLPQNHDWYVGISEIRLPMLYDDKNLREKRDVLFFDNTIDHAFDLLKINNSLPHHETKELVLTLDQITQYFLENSSDPSIYNVTYFNEFLTNFHFNAETFDSIFGGFTTVSEFVENEVVLNFSLKKDVFKNRVMDSYLPPIKKSHFQYQRINKFFETSFLKVNRKKKYTFKELLISIVKQLFSYLLRYYEALNIPAPDNKFFYDILQEHLTYEKAVNKSRMYSNKLNELMQFFILRFVKSVLKNRTKVLLADRLFNVIESPHFIFVNSDIVLSHQIGSLSLQVLKVLVLDRDNTKNHYFQSSEIEYHKVANNYIRDVNLFFTDELGNQIKFVNSYVPTFVILKFKGVLKNG